MKSGIFGLSLLVVSVFTHIVCRRYLSFWGVEPDILFLVVVACGFVCGPITGQTMGFILGLVADSMGAQLFGFQTLLFVICGYVAGMLRRRIDSERPAPQMVIAFGGTLFYAGLAALVRHVFEGVGPRAPFWAHALEGVMNAILMPFIFWIVGYWTHVWRLDE